MALSEEWRIGCSSGAVTPPCFNLEERPRPWHTLVFFCFFFTLSFDSTYAVMYISENYARLLSVHERKSKSELILVRKEMEAKKLFQES